MWQEGSEVTEERLERCFFKGTSEAHIFTNTGQHVWMVIVLEN